MYAPRIALRHALHGRSLPSTSGPRTDESLQLCLRAPQLMKKLRSAKTAQGSKEDKKKVNMELDAGIHKLLGQTYKQYRAVQVQAATALGTLAWPLMNLLRA
jgi:hypothetical protein